MMNNRSTKKSAEDNNQIPFPKRDFPLMKRLMPVVLGGFDKALNKKEGLYLRLLCRLIDKSFDEYLQAREYILEELKSKDKLAYRFQIINHLENCINALNRASAVFIATKKEEGLGKIISKVTKKKIERLSVYGMRNAVEHIDKDIRDGRWQKGLFLDVDDVYENICINTDCISFKGLVHMIEQFYALVLEILNNLPNRWENGKFHYSKKINKI